MKIKSLPKFFPKNKKNNIIVELTILDDKKNKYKCTGVLMKENNSVLRIGFNARNNTVIDYLDVKIKQILDIKMIKSKEIKNLR
ncbi:MAG: hypothetical protein ACYC1K_02640 [Minisyncoccota bacterium]